MNFTKFPRTTFLTEHLQWLFLSGIVNALFSFTMQRWEPANIQLKFLQRQQIVCLEEKMWYQSVIPLNPKSRSKLT